MILLTTTPDPILQRSVKSNSADLHWYDVPLLIVVVIAGAYLANKVRQYYRNRMY